LSKSLVRSQVRLFTMVRRRHLSPASSMTKLRKPTCKPVYRRKKISKLFAGLGSVRIVKNCDLGLENAALGLRPRAAFSRPWSQFFTIRTSQPANNIKSLINQACSGPYWENIGPRSFLYGPSAARSVLSRPRADILPVRPSRSVNKIYLYD